MAGDDDSRDDAERTRIGGMPPPAPKPQAPPASPPEKTPAPAAEPGGEGERTQLAPARPPGVPGAPAMGTAAPGATSPPPPPAGEDAAERTRILAGAPPRPAPAGAPPAAAPPAPSDAGERTRVVGSAPPGAPRPSASGAPGAAPPAPAGQGPTGTVAVPREAAPVATKEDVTVDPLRGRAASDEERTVILPRKTASTLRLKRVAPSSQAEMLTLERPNLVLGRGHGCDVKLFTPTASREHARIWFEDGQWKIAAMERKSLYVDGVRQAQREVRLRNGMKLRLGDDELVVAEAGGAAADEAPRGGIWTRLVAFVKGLIGRRG
jgi:hypothetical protein